MFVVLWVAHLNVLFCSVRLFEIYVCWLFSGSGPILDNENSGLESVKSNYEQVTFHDELETRKWHLGNDVTGTVVVNGKVAYIVCSVCVLYSIANICRWKMLMAHEADWE